MKVLVADDEPLSRRLLESLLSRWGYEVILAEDGYEAARKLQSSDPPKLVVVDWMMPGLDGTQLCREIRQRKNESYTYILLVTGRRTKSDVIEGLEAGADDYIIKPFDSHELKVRLRTGKRILYLQEQLIAARDALRDMAMHDPLTGLWSRAAVLDILNSEVARAQRQGASLGVVLADLDKFKLVNDTHGHPIGDTVLSSAAHAMRGVTRPYDAIGRYGGEEFLMVLPGCDGTNAVSHAERMRAAVERIALTTPSGPLGITASFGVAICQPGPATDANALIQAADAALYRAKSYGRNRVELAAPCEVGHPMSLTCDLPMESSASNCLAVAAS